MQVCTRCLCDLPREAFHAKAAAASGLQPMCKTCQKDYAREWYAARPKGAESRRRRHAQNRERHAENHRRWYEANRAERIMAARRWRAENPERARALGRLRNYRKRYGLTPEAIDYAHIVLADPCCYCGRVAEHVDHIAPLAKGGGNGWDNFTGACRRCNGSKRDTPLLLFMLRRKQET